MLWPADGFGVRGACQLLLRTSASLSGIEANWIKNTPDGDKVMARYRAILNELRAGS